MNVKGKVLQLLLDCDVVVENCLCERSKLNGDLSVTMLKLSSKGMNLKNLYECEKKLNSVAQKNAFNEAIEEQLKPAKQLREQLKEFEKPRIQIKEVKYVKTEVEPITDDTLYDGEEYSDVPPLC